MRRLQGLAAFVAASVVGGAAAAQDRGVVFAGGQIGEDQSGYAGVVHALPGATLGRGWAVRATASAGAYSYDADGVDIDGRYFGGEIAAVHQLSGDWGYLNLGAGVRYTDTDLEPRDPDNDRQGGQVDLGLTVDGARTFGPWRAEAYGAYGVDMEDYQTRVGLNRAVSDRLRVGVEGGLQGDDNYRRRFIGVTGGTSIAGGGEFRVSVGVDRQSGRGERAYVGAAISRVF